MTMISAIEASVRKRGVAVAAEILADIGARDMHDRETACALMVEMCKEGRLEPRVMQIGGFRLPCFRWMYTPAPYRAKEAA